MNKYDNITSTKIAATGSELQHKGVAYVLKSVLTGMISLTNNAAKNPPINCPNK